MAKNKSSNSLRIIAGQWRGRKLGFADVEGLRPTADRIRETLFNWLQPVIPGARCLDLFAGSGALGFEAASRGAGEVLMLEQQPAAVRCLQQAVRLLQADHIAVRQTDTLNWLQYPTGQWDVVFVDPPYAMQCVPQVLQLLAQGDFLKPGGRIYIEDARERGEPEFPAGFELLRSKAAGQVGYYLARRTS